jgi:hypothetical protein
VEKRGYERMEKLRQYQLNYPEDATEGMNRVAQALICLTDPVAKRAYDAAQFPDEVAKEPPQPSQPRAAGDSTDPLAWLFGPAPPGATATPAVPTEPPQRVTDWQAAPPPPARINFGSESPQQESPTTDESPPDADAAMETPQDKLPDANFPDLLQTAEEHPARAGIPRKGLGTKRALFARISRTRQILGVWRQAGKYLNQPKRPLTKPSEATDLLHQMESLRELLRWSPRLVGQAGQPGYLVHALARQQIIVPTLQTLLPSQREALMRDWQAGHESLVSYLQFLRVELRELRRRNRVGRALRAVGLGIINNPGLLLLILALIAVNITFYNLVAARLTESAWGQKLSPRILPWIVIAPQVAAVGILVVAKFLWSWWIFRPIQLPGPRAIRVVRSRSKARAAAQGRPATPGVNAKTS